MPEPLDIDAIEARANAATKGPWAWRGQGDGSVELRSPGVQGGARIITTQRSEPCIWGDGDSTLYLNRQQCGMHDGDCEYERCQTGPCRACRTAYETGDLHSGRRCAVPENLDTVWVWNPLGFCEPINRHVVYEVARIRGLPDDTPLTDERIYRTDVVDTRHPDAQFIQYAREDVPALIAEVRRLREENARLASEPTDDEIYTVLCAYDPSHQTGTPRKMRAALRVFLDGRRGAGRD